MVRVFAGAALLAAGIVALIEGHSHKPLPSIDITKRFNGGEAARRAESLQPGLTLVPPRDAIWCDEAFRRIEITAA